MASLSTIKSQLKCSKQGGVGGEDEIVGLNHSGGKLGGWVDGELNRTTPAAGK